MKVCAMATDTVDIFLGGDVMTGRGIDQILPHPGKPQLHEPWVRDARTYVNLAEEKNGLIPAPVNFAYVWGDALEALRLRRPQLRLVNLETAVTASDDWWRGKGINYRMNPDNAAVLTAAGIDLCSLANNHVLDWGREGLVETLASLNAAGIRYVGAGPDRARAEAPAIAELPAGGRLLVYSVGEPGSGIPPDWEASTDRSGVHLLPEVSETTADDLARKIRTVRRPGDVVILSIHWGGNWGYYIPGPWRRFAHRLIGEGVIDLVHGHSSHHPKGIEVHGGRLILYGCGDLINDYEGIGDYDEYRPELALLYFPRLDAASGRLVALEMVPVRMRKFRLQRADDEETQWLKRTLTRESRELGSNIEVDSEGRMLLHWH